MLFAFLLRSTHAEGVKTPYTDVVQTLLTDNQPSSSTFLLRCWTDPKNDLYMGIEQRVIIHAPLQNVNAVVLAIDEYDQLFPDYKKIKVVSRANNRFTVYFEQKVPVFFIPNVKYEMLYTELGSDPSRKVFWYQLKEAGTIKSSDGLIILKKSGENETEYTEYDFFDANWGAAKIAGKDKLWRDVVAGIYLSDLAMKLKAEDPKLSASDAREQAKKIKIDELINTCVDKRVPWVTPSIPVLSPTPTLK
jgi:hypothetical protein